MEIGIGSENTAFGLNATREQCSNILEFAAQNGIRIASAASGIYWSRSLADETEQNRKAAFEDLERLIEISGWLKVKTLLVIPGAVDVFFMPERQPLDYQHVWNHATEGIKQAVPIAQRHNVRIGIENVWNRFLMSPNEMLQFIEQLNSPFVGAYLDVANVLPFGYPEQWLRILGKHVVGVHFKDFRRSVGTADGFVDLLEGDVNWPAVVAALKAIEYEGPIVAEMIPPYKHHPLVRIANTSNAMDAILTESS